MLAQNEHPTAEIRALPQGRLVEIVENRVTRTSADDGTEPHAAPSSDFDQLLFHGVSSFRLSLLLLALHSFYRSKLSSYHR